MKKSNYVHPVRGKHPSGLCPSLQGFPPLVHFCESEVECSLSKRRQRCHLGDEAPHREGSWGSQHQPLGALAMLQFAAKSLDNAIT